MTDTNDCRPVKKRCMSKALSTKHTAANRIEPDQLSWKQVEFPLSFDDAEGFYGLEEISDVEVSKEGTSGKVVYQVRESKRKIEKPSKHVQLSPHTAKQEDKLKRAGKHVYGDLEWNGFDDEPAPNGYRGDGPANGQQKRPNGTASINSNANGFYDISTRGFDPSTPHSQNVEDIYVSAWKSLGLSEDTLTGLASLKFAQPTAIQQQAIPQIIAGHDLIGKASTGSGKTLAFAIPILEYHSKLLASTSAESQGQEAAPKSLALILSPTRELAHQLSVHFTSLFTQIQSRTPRLATVTGGLSAFKQKRLLNTADVVIGTPGRLWEIIGGDNELLLRMQKVRFLVLDEADRLLSDGHYEDVELLLRALNRRSEANGESTDEALPSLAEEHTRQTLVFSATFEHDLHRKLMSRFKPSLMKKKPKDPAASDVMTRLLEKLEFREPEPCFVDANPQSQMADNLSESMVLSGTQEKDLYLYTLLLLHQAQTRILIFVNSISAVRRLVPFLEGLNIRALPLHSQMAQKARLRSLERFSDLKPDQGSILVATDVAARGLDIAQVQIVMHYHVPRAADAYVHRSGRTARASAGGKSILLCAPDEVQGIQRLVAKIHARDAKSKMVDKSGNESEDDNQADHKISTKPSRYLNIIELDRRVLERLKPRVSLSQQITNTILAQEKSRHEDSWIRTAAADLGVDYDSDEFESATAQTQRGRGKGRGRKRKEKEAMDTSKHDIASLRAMLKQELNRRVNVGVSERYLTAGGIDVDALLAETELKGQQGHFLGKVKGLDE